MSEFGDYLKNMRQSIGWTQRQFAEALGIRKDMLQNIELGKLEAKDKNLLMGAARYTVKQEMRKRRGVHV